MRDYDLREVFYDFSHWKLLQDLRKDAIKIIESLYSRNIVSAIYGSVTRGDVNKNSDVDVIILDVMSSSKVELALKMAGFKMFSRKIAQATPSHAPKAHIYLDVLERCCITFPLASLSSIEHEFYKFGGLLHSNGLREGKRVPGCDKRLKLIRPTITGHLESTIIGREREVAKIVGVSVEMVLQRVRVLTRRKQVGRTGIVFAVDLAEDEIFEEVLERHAKSNPIVRRRLRKKG